MPVKTMWKDPKSGEACTCLHEELYLRTFPGTYNNTLPSSVQHIPHLSITKAALLSGLCLATSE